MSLKDWLRGLTGDVPARDAVCEFRCRKVQCRHGEWERCDFRLRGGLPVDLPDASGEPGSATHSA